MAYNPNRKPEQQPTAGKIIRTPAPILDRQHGGLDYGQANDYRTPSSIAPGVPQPMTVLGQNLKESSDDGEGVLDMVVKGGVAGRGDDVPVDNNSQTRKINDTPYPTTFGHRNPNPPTDILK